MGKKNSIKESTKTHKHEKKQQINSLIKILRPKVYITDSSNFKNLVQQLTGNGDYNNSPVSSPPTSVVGAAPVFDHGYQDNISSSLDLSFDSSCFSTPLEGSPDLQLPNYSNNNNYNYVMESNNNYAETIDFSSEFKDLESLLMELDRVPVSYNDYDDHHHTTCYGNHHMIQQEVCTVYDYDYDFSSLIM